MPTNGPGTIAVGPGAGGTVLVEFTNSFPPVDEADVLWSDALFVPAEGFGAGVITAPTGGLVTGLAMDTIPSAITAMRVTASAAGARVEVAQ